jgi:hypothetical protein
MDFTQAATQKSDPTSLLNHYTRLLRLRDNYDALRGGISYFVPSYDGSWDCMRCEANRLAIIREYFGEKILVVHNFSGANLDIRVDLSHEASGLEIPHGTEVHPLMGRGSYPAITESNRNFYPVGNVNGFSSKVLFLGDIAQYLGENGNFLTYEYALGQEVVPPAIPTSFTCDNGITNPGQSVYVVGDTAALGGNWNTDNAAKLTPSSYPAWSGVISLPANSRIEWKCIIRDEDSPFQVHRWGPGPNSVINTPGAGVFSAEGTL